MQSQVDPVRVAVPLRLLTAEQVADKLQVKVSWVHERTRERCPKTERIPHIRCRVVATCDSPSAP
jgi:hypothetical protein